MTRLLDINVLMALAWPNHPMRSAARAWLVAQIQKGRLTLATCPITELGFTRVSMNVKGYAQDFVSATALLRTLIESAEFKHEFWADSVSLLAIASRARLEIGAAQLTDLYLVELAKSRGGRLVTFERGIKDASAEIIDASAQS